VVFTDRTEHAYDLATLTDREAQKLEGRRARFVITLDSLPTFWGRYTGYDCLGPPGIHAGVWIIGNAENAPDTFEVEATLMIADHPA
jgi:hypothetical protein